MSTVFVFEEAVEERVPYVGGVHPAIRSMSKHGWKRWCERSGRPPEARRAKAKAKEWERLVTRLKRALTKAEEVQLKPRYRAVAIMNNGFKGARYYRADGFIFVVSEDEGQVMTVHTGEARRWEPMPETAIGQKG